jgi:hypothetical protein
MAVSEAVGSETQKPFAIVIVCGMVTTLVVALFFVPVLYRLLASSRMRGSEDLTIDFSEPKPHAHHPAPEPERAVRDDREPHA